MIRKTVLVLLLCLTLSVSASAFHNPSQNFNTRTESPDSPIHPLDSTPIYPSGNFDKPLSKSTQGSEYGGLNNENRFGNGDNNSLVREVTLLTGQTVKIFGENDTRTYAVENSSDFYRVDTNRGTYIFPYGVDLEKFDIDLFNVDLLVEEGLTDSETGSIPVIVSFEGSGSVSSINGSGFRSDPLRVRKGLELIDSISADISKQNAKTGYRVLKRDESIDKVHLDRSINVTLNDSVEAIDGKRARQNYGVNGSGIKVAVLDSGIDNTHPDLNGSVIHEKDFTGRNNPHDFYGHGTHVAGIIAGDGTASDGKYVGVAPNASLINAKVLDEKGFGRVSWIVNGIEYAVTKDADVISMSLGVPTGTRGPAADAVRKAIDKGTVVSVAAGNSGPRKQTITSPGVVERAITVGAINDETGNVTGFSSRGPTETYSLIKPEVVAPGFLITSAYSKDSDWRRVVDKRYVKKSGTSMATPHVSGAAALILDKNPGWSPSKVKSSLVNTAETIRSQDRGNALSVYSQGAGLINVSRALGTEILVKNSTVNFGNIVRNGTRSRNVVVRNLGNETRNITVEVESYEKKENKTGRDRIEINTTSLTVEPGGRAVVNLSVEVPDEIGHYSGRLFFRIEEGEEHVVPIGYTRRNRVRVEKSGLNGTKIQNDILIATTSRDRLGRDTRITTIETFGKDGVVELPGLEEYSLYSGGLDETSREPILISASGKVNRTTKIVLDENESVRYGLNMSEVNGSENLTPLNLNINYSRWGMNILHPESTRFRIGNASTSNHPHTGPNPVPDLRYVLVKESELDIHNQPSNNLDFSEVYLLSYSDKDDYNGREIRLDTGSLRAKVYRYYKIGDNRGYTLSFDEEVTRNWRTRDRLKQTFRTNKFIFPSRLQVTSDPDRVIDLGYSPRPLRAGDSYKDVGRHPYISDFRVSMNQVKNETRVSVSGSYQIDQRRNRYRDRRTNNSYTIKKSDKVVARGEYPSPSSIEDFRTSNGSIELRFVGRNPNGNLSKKTVTEYRSNIQDNYNLPFLLYSDVDGLNVNNTVNTGEITIYLDVNGGFIKKDEGSTDHLNITRFDVEYSVGNGWKDASVVELEKPQEGRHNYRATINVSTRSKPDLRIAGENELGTVFETTVKDAFRVAPIDSVSDVKVTGYEVPSKTEPGKVLPFEITVENRGEVGGLTHVPIYVDGEPVTSNFVWTTKRKAKTKMRILIFEEGNYTVRVGDLKKKKVRVAEKTPLEVIAGEDRIIDFNELQKAIAYWANDEKVPGTDKELDFEILQKIIAAWAENKKV